MFVYSIIKEAAFVPTSIAKIAIFPQKKRKIPPLLSPVQRREPKKLKHPLTSDKKIPSESVFFSSGLKHSYANG